MRNKDRTILVSTSVSKWKASYECYKCDKVGSVLSPNDCVDYLCRNLIVKKILVTKKY